MHKSMHQSCTQAMTVHTQDDVYTQVYKQVYAWLRGIQGERLDFVRAQPDGLKSRALQAQAHLAPDVGLPGIAVPYGN